MHLHWESHSGLAASDTLFIHGNLASTAWWGPTVDEWSRTGSLGPSALHLADWRGCGRNEAWTEGTFTLVDLARDFLHAMDERGLKKLDLVGHSLGGLIALQMMILEPARFGRAVLLDPVGADGVVFDDAMYEAFRQMAASKALTTTVIMSTIEGGAERLSPMLRERIAEDAFKAVGGIGTSVLEILKTVRLTDAARAVPTRTLILHGERDQVIPIADSEALARALPNASLQRLPTVGHCWNVEDPVAFTKRLKEWFK